MKGKKARRNLGDAYVDDMVDEMERLEAKGLSVDGTAISDSVQEMGWVDLPCGIRCLLVKSSLIVCKAGGVVAILTYTIEGVSVEPTIIVDRFFEQLSDRGRRFILAHEAGHLHYGHLGPEAEAAVLQSESADFEGSVLRNRNIEKEYCADAFAAQLNGKRNTIAAMKELRRLMAKNKWVEFDTEEMNRRIWHLMQARIKPAT